MAGAARRPLALGVGRQARWVGNREGPGVAGRPLPEALGLADCGCIVRARPVITGATGLVLQPAEPLSCSVHRSHWASDMGGTSQSASPHGGPGSSPDSDWGNEGNGVRGEDHRGTALPRGDAEPAHVYRSPLYQSPLHPSEISAAACAHHPETCQNTRKRKHMRAQTCWSTHERRACRRPPGCT